MSKVMPYPTSTLKNLKQSLKNREDFLSFDFLGRSLAYNPYMPRAEIFDFKREQDIAGKILFIESFDYEDIAGILDFGSDMIAIDFTSIYEKNIPSVDAFDCLTHLRRYTQALIIHNDIFLNQYQLLESAIYGSDCVVLDAGILGKELDMMCDFALRLSLVPIVKVASIEELKRAIFAKVDIFYIIDDFSNLLSALPNSKIVLRDLPIGIQSIDKKISYGVDKFLIKKDNWFD
ncbi:hypothetical protein [Helicobacter sp. 13S00477-4]|uniref:hypothetical protein n=1 Tax=Helicobacter sp. 13S00477-4 TaxID=1905759 RepID=UPI000BA6DE8D|nr:hypothetical protein [Helicobacter sp. 13S00477-4]PAF50505.1 hypothetical protein BKH44_07905 [Helicobacter sp. 13S00477-4]